MFQREWPELVRTVMVASAVAAAAVVGTGLSIGWTRTGLLASVFVVVAGLGSLPTGPAAGALGLLLPIQQLDAVPDDVLYVVSASLVAALAIRCIVEPEAEARQPGWLRSLPPSVTSLAVLLATQVVLRAAFAAGRVGVRPAYLVLGLGLVVVQVLIAGSTTRHRWLFLGFFAGATSSAVMSLLQVAEVIGRPTSATRYPGLAEVAADLSWQLSFAVVIGAGFAWRARGRWWRLAAAVGVLVCLAALATCGAQGGLVGLVAASLAIALHARSRASVAWSQVLRVAAVVVLVAGAAIVALGLLGIELTSVTGLAGDAEKGFENEVARLEGLRDGARALVDHPLAGPGRDRYNSTYDVPPHVAPVNAAVETGVAGLLVGAALVAVLVAVAWRGPARGAPLGWAGLGIVVSMVVMSFTTTAGPFDEFALSLLMFVAVAAMHHTTSVTPTRPGARPRSSESSGGT